MKIKILILLGFLAPSFVFATFDQNLKYGSSGTSVREMQNFLIKDGCLTGVSTGKYLTKTYTAVKCFQTKNSLPATGYFGPRTRIKANEMKSQSAGVPVATSAVVITPPQPSPSSSSAEVVGNGCFNKVKGDLCSYGAAPNGVCDNALNGDLLFCVPKHAQQ